MKPFLNIGLVNLFNVGTTVSLQPMPPSPSYEQLFQKRLEDSIGVFQFKAVAGGGVKYTSGSLHYVLSANYGWSTGITNAGIDGPNIVSSRINDFSVRLGVYFDLQKK